MSEFWEAYKDPRWQKKRLEVMEAAGYRCVQCGDASKTLNVHHRYYVKGAEPWEYDDRALACLCEPCHEKVTMLLNKLKTAAGLLSAANLGVLVSIASVMLSAEQPYAAVIAKLNAELKLAVEVSSDF